MPKKRMSEYAEEPYYLNCMVEAIGIKKTAEHFGYAETSIQKMLAGHMKTRKFVEVAAMHWVMMQTSKDGTKEKDAPVLKEPVITVTYVFKGDPDTSEIKALLTMLEALNISHTSL